MAGRDRRQGLPLLSMKLSHPDQLLFLFGTSRTAARARKTVGTCFSWRVSRPTPVGRTPVDALASVSGRLSSLDAGPSRIARMVREQDVCHSCKSAENPCSGAMGRRFFGAVWRNVAIEWLKKPPREAEFRLRPRARAIAHRGRGWPPRTETPDSGHRHWLNAKRGTRLKLGGLALPAWQRTGAGGISCRQPRTLLMAMHPGWSRSHESRTPASSR